jgi:hypothetical protein
LIALGHLGKLNVRIGYPKTFELTIIIVIVEIIRIVIVVVIIMIATIIGYLQENRSLQVTQRQKYPRTIHLNKFTVRERKSSF